ncbi:hypothetical protein J7U46_10020 [Pelomonas sp. V22]|uniref:ATP-grasp domain-containing protein n=1 Tax=Pelomonas sp. V22 TaxID=2822139 RepID=UPI0024A9D0AA|nr:hypothetical protein [Pelomonas sp. V22]MDI4633384.1 hypothetical protein [Pelomonas sp. V22]
MRFDVTLVTHQGLPQGSEDDLLLAEALRAQGCAVRCAVWNDAAVDWSASRLTLIRSTWDYHLMPAAWLAWLDQAAVQTRLVNPVTLMRWNTDKRYLGELAARGVRCLPTVFVEAQERPALQAIAAQQGWQELVLKPAVGAGASGARRLRLDQLAEAGEQHLSRLLSEGAALVQPYMAVVEEAEERCLVYIAGQYSHAFAKPSFSGGAAVYAAVRLHEASELEQAVAQQVLAAAPSVPLYARVDLIPDEQGPLLMELELIEPDMVLRLKPAAAERLAEACLGLLD